MFQVLFQVLKDVQVVNKQSLCPSSAYILVKETSK